jgi:hypothetical protein
VVLALVALGSAALVTSSATAAVTPSYTNYRSSAHVAAGEPTIGADWATGNAMFGSGTIAYRVKFNSANTNDATWTNTLVPANLVAARATLDTILYTDRVTNRTWFEYFEGVCSGMYYTDNDGGTWTRSTLGCGVITALDHPTIASGPYAAAPTLTQPSYSRAVYYCAQAAVEGACARSENGGDTFGVGYPYSMNAGAALLNADGMHCIASSGHAKAAPNDGTLYVPIKNCFFGNGNVQGLAVSSDNGQSWQQYQIPGSTTQSESDPSVGVGSDGTVYYGWQDGAADATGSRAKIAVSANKGASWSTPVDVGTAPSWTGATIKNVQFPAVVAGDGDRAAFAFLGTPSGGSDQAAAFTGVWHLYVATTFDRGITWTTVDATPLDPVQRGQICMTGTACSGNRNLLDFMDATVDKSGNVLVGYADGCTSACAGNGGTPSQSTDAWSTIARQTGGTGLFANP